MSFQTTESTGATRGGVAWLLRAEGLALLAAASALYAQQGGSAALFAACFLLPDLAMLAYLHSPQWGARAYNATHSTLGPLALGAWAWSGGHALELQLALVWLAHIGFDRAAGYGLKYAQAFGATHLGWRGRPAFRAGSSSGARRPAA